VSIRVRLLLLVLGTALLSAILVGWQYDQDRGKAIDVAITGLAATARTIATDLDAKIQATAQLHFGLSRARDLSGHDQAACSQFLSEVVEKNPQFTGVLTIDPDGNSLCDSLRSGRVLDLRDRDYFKQALNVTGSVVVEPVFGRLAGPAVLQIAYPARDASQQLQFVLLASLDLDRLMKEQTENLPRGFEILLADGKGSVSGWSSAQSRADRSATSVANSDVFSFVAENAGGTEEWLNTEGKARVWAAADVLATGGVDLRVIVGRSEAEVVAAANRRHAEGTIIIGLLSILLAAGVWLVAERGVRFQIGRIVAMVERLAAGDLTARVQPPYPSGELGGLMTVLNSAAASLERQRLDASDLNQKLAQSQQLEAQEKRWLDIAVSNMSQGLLVFDASARIVVCNRRFIEMFGLSADVIKPGCSFHDLITHRKETGSIEGDVDAYCASVQFRVAQGKITNHVVKLADGRSNLIVNQPLDGGGWVTTLEDITERTRSHERIAYLAHYDALTELPNRVLFREQLEQVLKGGEPLAVLCVDIDEFKSVNDSLGHSVGDELLKAVADRLRGLLRATDFVARLGGDEFAIIQTAIEQPADTTELVTRIYQAIRQPFECAGHLLSADACIGIALAPRDGTDLDQLLKNADLAMYEAKADGRRTCRFFEPGMDERFKALRTLELDLRQAIAEGGFELYYQPLVNLADGKVTGCEALLRWRHPVRGMISPVEFIPVAEETGLINPIGEWVLTTACAEAARWPDDVRIAVNVSPVQFRSQAFALKVTAALAASGLAPHRLEMEITEAVLIRDDEAALAMLHQLRALGVRIALDDFGTGYSSLSYLQRFPFDKIKIDRCFVKDVAESDGSGSIVQAVVNIAAARNMTTTAEGVETEQQRDMLRMLGCTEMQGWLFSPAIPAADIRQLLRSRSGKAVAAA
jgi:diguanylate cyclase (GGDEF)-like protein